MDRNLLRRRIRDVFRRNKAVWPERTDMVIVLSSGGAPSSCVDTPFASPYALRPAAALEAPYNDLEADMLSLGRKAGELARPTRAPRAPRQQQQQQQQQPQPQQQPAQRCVRRWCICCALC